jgi:hypothetical protein
MKQFILSISILILSSSVVHAGEDFKKEQKRQERIINKIYKEYKITDREYTKLIREQAIIKYTIQKYEMDGSLSEHEERVIRQKLDRAERRLERYKTNSEQEEKSPV